MRFPVRPVVHDRPLPWQKAQRRVTPQRVRQSLGAMFLQKRAFLPPPNRLQFNAIDTVPFQP
jgi:hypothetical protein